MIDDYRALAVFAAVAEAGSFSGAARRLKLSTSVVSHHVSKLEARLNVTLLFRSTRALSLTSEGERVLFAARRMVEAGEEALDVLADESDQPVGALRVTLPAFGLDSSVTQRVLAFARDHPMVAVSLHSSDQPVDLIKEGYDLAIRLGVLADSSLKSRRIGAFHRTVAAAPSYLETIPRIRTLEDLRDCAFISYAMLPDQIALVRGSETVTITPHNIRLEVNSVIAGKAAVLAGLGVLQLPFAEIAEELDDGRLVEVLPEWTLPTLGIYAVWPDMGPQKRLTRRLLDFLATPD